MARKKRLSVAGEVAEETRQTILRVAEQLFMTYGYRAVTTRQLAEVCGLTQPALYHYFADKEEIYLAVVSEEIAKIHLALERIVRRADNVSERLQAVAGFLLSRMHYDLNLMLHDVRYEVSTKTRDKLDAQFRQGFIVPIAAIFEQGIQRGELRGAAQGGMAAFPAAYLFMTMLSGFATRSPQNATARDLQAYQAASAETCVRILLHGIARSHE
jgi:AcrR family transcriptional regulator